jgi:MbtH protein
MMENDFDYKILLNEEGQYSLWPETKAAPPGWKESGPVGPKEEVLEWVKANWLDMRPASLRATLPS